MRDFSVLNLPVGAINLDVAFSSYPGVVGSIEQVPTIAYTREQYTMMGNDANWMSSAAMALGMSEVAPVAVDPSTSVLANEPTEIARTVKNEATGARFLVGKSNSQFSAMNMGPGTIVAQATEPKRMEFRTEGLVSKFPLGV